MKKIVKGNDFTLKIPVMKSVEGQKVPFPLPACTDVQVRICNQFKRISLSYEVDVENDNVILARVEGDQIPLGTYAIEVKGKIFGNDWRSNEYPQFALVANNADADTEFGETDEGDNSVEMDTALVILPPSVELSDLITKAEEAIADTKKAIEDVKDASSSIDGSEAERVKAEKVREDNESARAKAEGKRVLAEEARVLAEKKRESDFSNAKSECETATDNANTAAGNTNEAIRKCETATAGAEKCNVTLEGTKIIVTNRNGEIKETEVVDTEEVVTVVITSSVESISVAGLKVNVFLNNGKTPQTYTTNAEGKAIFTVNRGNYYQVTFPEYGNAQPIAPQGYTAVLADRNISVEYLPYDEDDMEKVVITATKYVEDVGTAWEGIPVVVTVDKKATTYQTDAKGQVTVFVPYKKEYTVRIDDQDGYNVSFNKNSRTYTANVPQRLIDYRFYQFKAGIFVVDVNKNEYYIEDWVAAGKNADDAVAIKVADASLSINHGTFCIRTSDIKNVSQLVSKQWCTQNLQFDSIALNGNNVKDANYYNGESSSFLIRQEAQERSLSVPAFDYAYEQIFSIGGEELHGFVMSIGQEYVHVANIGIIKQVLETLYGEEVATNYYNFVMKKARWTSTQSSATVAWNYSSSANYGNESSSYVVLPVYAC
nr:MAG TPA: hypothetical protein [Caudoviricetes sp.]